MPATTMKAPLQATRLPLQRPKLETGRSPSFQEFERFVVAATLEVMRQPRIDWLRKGCLQLVDFFGDGA